MQHKNSDLDKYSDYSEEKYDYDEEDDFSEELSKYKHAKESGHGKAEPKDQAKRPIMKGQQKQQQQQCMLFTLLPKRIKAWMGIHLKTQLTKPVILGISYYFLLLVM